MQNGASVLLGYYIIYYNLPIGCAILSYTISHIGVDVVHLFFQRTSMQGFQIQSVTCEFYKHSQRLLLLGWDIYN